MFQITDCCEMTLFSLPLPARRPPVAVSRLPPHDSAVRGHSVNFTCAFEGSPLPTITWYKDGVAIHLGDHSLIGGASNEVLESPVHTNSMTITQKRVRSKRMWVTQLKAKE